MWSITITSIFICNWYEHNLCLSVCVGDGDVHYPWGMSDRNVPPIHHRFTGVLLWTNNRTSLPKKLTWLVRVTGCCPVDTDQSRFSSSYYAHWKISLIPGFHLTSDVNECWGEAALCQAATKRLNEGVYCGAWSDPDRSLLSGLLPLRWEATHSFASYWLSLSPSCEHRPEPPAKSFSVWKMGRWKWR